MRFNIISIFHFIAADIKVPMEVERCIPLAEQRIEQLLDKYTLNLKENIPPELSPAEKQTISRAAAKSSIHPKKDIIARRNNGINVTGNFTTIHK